jgi:excinuclease ABC subunit A
VVGLEEGGENGIASKTCRVCNGLRLRKEALHIKISGLNIGELSRMSVRDSVEFLCHLELTDREQAIAARVLKEVMDRLLFLEKVGLAYLTLDRPSLTLSGGEAQRIRLATQLGSSLTGVLYVLDEPSMGLHPRDCARLLESLSSIRDSGNTVIVVEHDEDTIRWADHLVDMGPGAGTRGGWVTSSGSAAEIQEDERSLTGKYLNGSIKLLVPHERRKPRGFLEIRDAATFNLKNIDVKIPLGVFICVTGVSGSGKSTLVFEILFNSLGGSISGAKIEPGRHQQINGVEEIDRVVCIEQAPLGRTPRSNPATYTGIFTQIRNLFALAPEAKVRGYGPSRFSFNLQGGRCEDCGGDGMKKVEMHFLPDVYIPCDTCRGMRYNRETLEIRYKGKTISGILEMTVSEALRFFQPIPPLRRRLEVLENVGLGYIQLGQPAPTLSAGEAQRIRLSRELGKRVKGRNLYLLDEPTTGLHFVDTERLLNVISTLVDMGNTVLVIEHNPEVVKSADYLIDMGPEGGDEGGEVVAAGTPEEVSLCEASYTGRYLKNKLPPNIWTTP